jgi:hypothetical protein
MPAKRPAPVHVRDPDEEPVAKAANPSMLDPSATETYSDANATAASGGTPGHDAPPWDWQQGGSYDDPAANTVDPVDDTASACCSHWDPPIS